MKHLPFPVTSDVVEARKTLDMLQDTAALAAPGHDAGDAFPLVKRRASGLSRYVEVFR